MRVPLVRTWALASLLAVLVAVKLIGRWLLRVCHVQLRRSRYSRTVVPGANPSCVLSGFVVLSL